jgi:putative acetyltransferase
MRNRDAALEVRLDDLTGDAIAELLHGHLAFAAQNSPDGAVHALDLEGLRQPDVTFWSVWQDTQLLGCGAMRQLTPTHGEIKSMRTAPSHLRKGVAATLLQHMLEVARQRGYTRLSLETGNNEAFAPARALYARFGFAACSPFGNYVADGFSLCMTREL